MGPPTITETLSQSRCLDEEALHHEGDEEEGAQAVYHEEMPEVWAEVKVEGKKLEVFLNSGPAMWSLWFPPKLPLAWG
jgi:hypothetical protein